MEYPGELEFAKIKDVVDPLFDYIDGIEGSLFFDKKPEEALTLMLVPDTRYSWFCCEKKIAGKFIPVKTRTV